MPDVWSNLPERFSGNPAFAADINALMAMLRLIKGGASVTPPVSDIYALKALMDDTRTNWIHSNQKAAANGVATLGADSKIPAIQLPAIALSEFLGAFALLADALADAGVQASQKGDWFNVTDPATRATYIVIVDNPTTGAHVQAMLYPGFPVTSVNSQTGDVVLNYDILPEAGVPSFHKFKFNVENHDPDASNDLGAGYRRRDFWYNTTTGKMWMCYEDTPDGVWKAFQTLDEKGIADGYGSLDGTGKQPLSELAAHASTHLSAGSDPIDPSDLGSPTTLIDMVSADGGSIVEGHALIIAGDGTVSRARANSMANAKAIGLAWAGPVTIGNPVKVATFGEFAMADWTPIIGSVSLTPMAEYFLSPTDFGKLVSAFRSSGQTHACYIGVALDTQTMFLKPEKPVEIYNP